MVLTFALVAVYIPMKPAMDEHPAPIIKAKVLPKPKPMYIPKISIRENKNKIEYSFLINDIAPLWISSDISTIFPSPGEKPKTNL